MAESAPMRIYAGRQTDYINNARQLVKHGTRNIAVVLHDGRFYAMDNACYHHGGPLLRGDIEDMGGHPCIVCPWHDYRITLDTGEGLYLGIDIDPDGGKPRQTTKSKGKKQRIYPVSVEADGSVYVLFDLSGPKIESDTYAGMAIANKEQATGSPIRSGGTGGRGPWMHSGVGVEQRSGHVFQAMHSGSTGGLKPGAVKLMMESQQQQQRQVHSSQVSLLPPGQGDAVNRAAHSVSPSSTAAAPEKPAFMARCTEVRAVCADVKEFLFTIETAVSASVVAELMPGRYVEVELPIRIKHAEHEFLRRKWTIVEVDGPKLCFTLMVKRKSPDSVTSGSAWLHECALHTSLPVLRIGGSLTIAQYAQRIRGVEGHLLWLSGGIGITTAYANLKAVLGPGAINACGPLKLVHIHVDKTVQSVPKLLELSQWVESCHPGAREGGSSELLYSLRLFLTEQRVAEDSSSVGDDISAVNITYGRRLQPQDIMNTVGLTLGPQEKFLCCLCGPAAFVEMGIGALLSIGVAETDILLDDP